MRPLPSKAMPVTGKGFSRLDRHLEPRIVEEVAAVQADGPDLRPFRHRVIKAPVMHGERIDAPLRLGEAPGAGIVGLESAAGDIEALAVVGHRRQALGATAGNAVVELAEIGGVVVEAEAVDETAVEVGGIERLRRRVIRQAADTGPLLGAPENAVSAM